MFLYNPQKSIVIDNTGATIKKQLIFDDKSAVCFSTKEGKLVVLDTNSKNVIDFPFSSSIHDSDFSICFLNGEYYIGLQFSEFLNPTTIIKKNKVLKYEENSFVILHESEIIKVAPLSAGVDNHFLKSKVLKNNFGFSFLYFENKIAYFSDFSAGVFPGFGFHKGITENYNFNNFSLCSSFYNLNDSTILNSRIDLNVILGRSWFEKNLESFIRYNDVIGNVFFSSNSENEANLFYLVISDVAKTASNGLFFGKALENTTQYGSIIKIDDFGRIIYKKTPNCFGSTNSKEIPMDSIFENFSFFEDSLFSYFDDSKNTVCFVKSYNRFKKILYTFNNNTVNISRLSDAYEDIIVDLTNNFYFIANGDFNSLIANYEKTGRNVFQKSLDSVFDPSSSFNIENKSCYNVYSLLSADVVFDNFKGFVGTPFFQFNETKSLISEFKREGKTAKKIFSFSDCNGFFAFDLSLSCKNSDKLFFEGVKNFYLENVLVLSKKLYNFYNNFGFVKTVNISDDLPSTYQHNLKKCISLNESFFACVDPELKDFYVCDFQNFLNNNVFRKKIDFGVSFSFDDFKVTDNFTFRCFSLIDNLFFIVISRNNQSFFVFLEDLEKDLNELPNFGYPDSLFTTGFDSSKKVKIRFNKTKPYPFFRIEALITDISSDFSTKLTENLITINGDVPGYFDEDNIKNVHFYAPKPNNPTLFEFAKDTSIRAGNKYTVRIDHFTPNIIKTNKNTNFSKKLYNFNGISVLREGFSTVSVRILNNPENQNASFTFFLYKINNEGLATLATDVFFTYDGKYYSIHDDLFRKTVSQNQIDFSLVGLLPNTKYELYALPISLNFNSFINDSGENVLIRKLKTLDEIKKIPLVAKLDFETISVPNIEVSEIKKVKNSLNFTIKPYLKDENCELFYTYFKKEKTLKNGFFKSYNDNFIIDQNLNENKLFDSVAYLKVPANNSISITQIDDHEDVFLIFNFINRTKANEVLFSKSKSISSEFYFSGEIDVFSDLLSESTKPFIKKGFVKFFENDQKRNLAELTSPLVKIVPQFDFVKIKIPRLEYLQSVSFSDVEGLIKFDHRFLTGYNFFYKSDDSDNVNVFFVDVKDSESFKLDSLLPGKTYKYFIEPCFTSDIPNEGYKNFIKETLGSVDYNKSFSTVPLTSFGVHDFSVVEQKSDGCVVQKPPLDKLQSFFPTIENFSKLSFLTRIFNDQKVLLKTFKSELDNGLLTINQLDEKKNYFMDFSVVLNNNEKNSVAPVNYKPFSTFLKTADNYDLAYESFELDEDAKKINFVFSTANPTSSFSAVIKDQINTQIPFLLTKTSNLIKIEIGYSQLIDFSKRDVLISLKESIDGFESENKNFCFSLPVFFSFSDFIIEKYSDKLKFSSAKKTFGNFINFYFSDTSKKYFTPNDEVFNQPFYLNNLEANKTYELQVQAQNTIPKMYDFDVFYPLVTQKIQGFQTNPYEIFKSFLKKKDDTGVTIGYEFIGLNVYATASLLDFDNNVIAGFSDIVINSVVESTVLLKRISFDETINPDTVASCVFKFKNSSGTITYLEEKCFLEAEELFVKFDKYKQLATETGLLKNAVTFDFLLDPYDLNYSVEISENTVKANTVFETVTLDNKNKKVLAKITVDEFSESCKNSLKFVFENKSLNLPSKTIEVKDITVFEKEFPAVVPAKNIDHTYYEFIKIPFINNTGTNTFLCELFYKETENDLFKNSPLDTTVIKNTENFDYFPSFIKVLKDGFYKLIITSKNSANLPLNNTGAASYSCQFAFKNKNINLPIISFKGYTCEKEPLLNFSGSFEKDERSDYLLVSNDGSVLLNDTDDKWISYNIKDWNFIILPFSLETGKNTFFVKGFNATNNRFSKIERLEFFFDDDFKTYLFPNKIHSARWFGFDDGTNDESIEENRLIKLTEDFTFAKISYRIKNEHGLVVSDDTKTVFQKKPRLNNFYIFTDFFGQALPDGKYLIEIFLYDKNGLEKKCVKTISLVINRTSIASPRIKYDSQTII